MAIREGSRHGSGPDGCYERDFASQAIADGKGNVDLGCTDSTYCLDTHGVVADLISDKKDNGFARIIAIGREYEPTHSFGD